MIEIFTDNSALAGLLFMAVMVVAALLVHGVVYAIIRRLASRTPGAVDDSLVRHSRSAARLALVLLALNMSLPVQEISAGTLGVIQHALSLAWIGVFALALAKALNVFEDYIRGKYDITQKDNLRARKIHTQFAVFKRIMFVVIVILAVSTMLMSFDKLRQLGTTILASAGIAGVIVGMAAQKNLANLLAGIQIAVTQPFRIDDVVIVEGEWGRIEEITFTYVVVRIWDLRRLVLPISYFIDNPFQNWTRSSSDIMGTVFLYVDYTVPVQAVREELKNICESASQWDGKVCVLQVTGTSDTTMELRALVSAKDASLAWELRCLVREKLVDFIQSRYPYCLPRVREYKYVPPEGGAVPED